MMTVGPLTTRIAPNRAAVLNGNPSTHFAATAVNTQLTAIPTVTREKTARPVPRRSAIRRLKPPSNKINATDSWTVGQLVSVAVPIRARQSTLTVPRDALVLRHNGAFVFRINDDNNAEQVAVEVGDSAGDMIAVEGSLSQGDRVAIRGAENLRDGMATKILVSSLSTEPRDTEG